MPVSIATTKFIDMDSPHQFGLHKENRILFTARDKDGGAIVVRITMREDHRKRLSEILLEDASKE